MDADTARSLRQLLDTRPVAALATLHRGDPAVSMVPFVLPAGETHLVIHISALAVHTRDLQTHPRAGLMIMAEAGATPAQALPRVSLQVEARTIDRGLPAYDAARAAYLSRFPDAEPTFGLGDFAIVALTPVSARLVAGFGRAYSLVGEPLQRWLRGDTLG